VVGDADQDSLDACQAEALVIEVTTLLIDACDWSGQRVTMSSCYPGR
jgi:hypothetical protein